MSRICREKYQISSIISSKTIMPKATIPLAVRVCANCKARKKKCDKVLPCCGYCTKKGLKCQHIDDLPPTSHHKEPAKWIPYPSPALTLLDTSLSAESNLCHEAQRILGTSGLYLDELSVRYFEDAHNFLPVISREHFHTQLLSCGSYPQLDFSILLLSILVLVCHQDEGQKCSRHLDITSPYLAAKSLHAQAQTLARPSLNLVQAGILIALFEFARGRPDQAFVSIGASARMAYAAGLWQPTLSQATTSTDVNDLSSEEYSTWWGISILERLIVCDLDLIDQPLLSVLPKDTPEIYSHLTSGEPDRVLILPGDVLQEGLCQGLRAASLLDHLLTVISVPGEPDWRKLGELDAALQVLLSEAMPKASDSSVYCLGICVALRSLFLLHRHILSYTNADVKSPKDTESNSRAAVETLIRMLLDISETHQRLAHTPGQMGSLHPGYTYLVRAAVEYIREGCSSGQPVPADSWLQNAELRLESELERLNSGRQMGWWRCSLTE
ncbi:Zn(II)2Cys6 transcription factor [Aspergillus stella-maris]|uniref:Zn(II)2Cys6 transcription factor n=1 Tax=Aspergillus stella-maris TaxID=1810926 RepID=UPI003CCD9510